MEAGKIEAIHMLMIYFHNVFNFSYARKKSEDDNK